MNHLHIPNKIRETKWWKFLSKIRNKYVLINNYKKAKRMPCCDYEEYLQKRTSEFLNRFDYSRPYSYVIDFNNPRTFTEKCQWLKLYDQSEEKEILTDKYLVRKFIEKKIGKDYLVPLISIDGIEYFDSVKKIDFNKLPEQFVIKCTHGSHMNIVVKEKSKLSKREILSYKKTLKNWLKRNYAFYVGLELQYKNLKPGIIIEEYIEEIGHSSLSDYKVFCFKGEPKFISVMQERFTDSYTETIFDLNFKKAPFSLGNYNHNYDVEPPKELPTILNLSKTLSKSFLYVRVDFYIVNSKVLFGELTFSPGAGFDFPNPMSYDQILGDLIQIDNKKRELNYNYRKL